MARQDQANDQFSLTSFLYGGNADYIEELYAQWQEQPDSVGDEWRDFFSSLKDDAADVPGTRAAHPGRSRAGRPAPMANSSPRSMATGARSRSTSRPRSRKRPARTVVALSGEDVLRATRDSVRAIMMIRAYRMRGHLHADLDPLGMAEEKEDYDELSPEAYGFTEADYDRPIFIDHVLGLEFATVREMLDILRRTYCSTLGVEFMHISNPEEKGWIQERIEGPDKAIEFSPRGKIAILQKLIEAEGFEQFIDVKYKGTKRFGLDGGEALIPALEQIIKRGGAMGLKEIVLGMAHRGRLNVLSQVMAKPHRAIFHEFKGGSFAPDDVEGSGDVKYHLGASSDREFDGNNVHLSLTANPSHLEIVNPVVMGKARAKQDQIFGRKREEVVPLEERAKVLPLLLHGDAAFAGQGVVAECFGLSGLRGHRVAGSVHFIINNQIGFTTNPRFSRSSPYPSDVAKMIEAPIFHVNGDDPEAVVYAAKVAIEFRMKFQKPVVIDMFCYRRFGHNEGDEPAFTQPIMYRNIRSHQTTVQIYSKKLIEEGLLTEGEIDKMKADWRAHLEASSSRARTTDPTRPTGWTVPGRACAPPTTRTNSAAARRPSRSSR
jgi:2-oxoglutarate dehydrogenase E1 component